MIRLSNSLSFTFDKTGIERFIELFEELRLHQKAELKDIPFLQKDGSEKPVTLIFTIGEENTLKSSKTRVQIAIEQEDAEDTLDRFRDARSKPEELYPEWVQVKKLSTHKNTYLYVFFDTSLKKPV